MNTFQTNFDWQQCYLPQVSKILRLHAGYFVDFVISNEEQDTRQATDMVLTVSGAGTFAVRIRRPDCVYRDFTIRSQSRGGGKTELEKLREGWGNWYLYAWCDQRDQLSEWVLVDLHCLRESGLLERKRREQPNGDGTFFIAIPVPELRTAESVIAEHVHLSLPNKPEGLPQQVSDLAWKLGF